MTVDPIDKQKLVETVTQAGATTRSAIDHTLVQGCLFKFLESVYYSFSIRIGPARISKANTGEDPCGRHATSHNGYGVAVALGNCFLTPRRLELLFLWRYSWFGPRCYSTLHWNLSLPTVIAGDSLVIHLLFEGDIERIREQFSKRLASPFDTFQDGTTLLHVSIDCFECSQTSY